MPESSTKGSQVGAQVRAGPSAWVNLVKMKSICVPRRPVAGRKVCAWVPARRQQFSAHNEKVFSSC